MPARLESTQVTKVTGYFVMARLSTESTSELASKKKELAGPSKFQWFCCADQMECRELRFA